MTAVEVGSLKVMSTLFECLRGRREWQSFSVVFQVILMHAIAAQESFSYRQNEKKIFPSTNELVTVTYLEFLPQ